MTGENSNAPQYLMTEMATTYLLRYSPLTQLYLWHASEANRIEVTRWASAASGAAASIAAFKRDGQATESQSANQADG